jgi:hypothetical protein
MGEATNTARLKNATERCDRLNVTFTAIVHRRAPR